MVEAQSAYVLDASALLAWLQGERGSKIVEFALLEGSCSLSAVNYSEVVAKLVDYNVKGSEELAAHIASMGVRIVAFDASQALLAGQLRQQTKIAGLSLGDRACLALAQIEKAEVLTADEAWLRFKLPLTITNIRQ